MAMRRLTFVFLNILIFAASSLGQWHTHPNTSGVIRRADLECPEPTGAGICVENCTSDNNCTWPFKCCSNGCGHDCTMPITNGEFCFYKGKMYRNGQSFKDECNTCNCRKGRMACTDMACGGKNDRSVCSACCCTYLGKGCYSCNGSQRGIPKLIRVSNPKPGKCPKPNGLGICILGCTSDWCCPGAEKCCSNGCGRVCTKPVITGGSCFHKGKVYKNGETFKDLCNSCTCTEGVVTCTLRGCLPKPGKCPTLEPEAPGICVLGCLSDWYCPDDEKCCGIDCSNLCMKPVDGLSPGPNCTGVVCPELNCNYHYIPRGKCCSVCPPPIPSL